ncbi:hypothetical protein SAMN05428988_1341 [Chitinophaga sp. YR573]|uniref:hypothetical protein n=1 Tax=Chitinophaga sp. YR573 TaxID=1881040 RepID=UPI0008B6AA46|nr:hypothetical protein [Chitinophaga sp. YR573]SEW02225.1 hypothetical protein SAMN05428988_1341 [Chitinophaga sp. YR573]
MKYPVIKLVVKGHEMPALIQMMSLVIQPAGTSGVDSKLLICLMQHLYYRLSQKAIMYQHVYHISVPIPEAMAFQEYWTGVPMGDIITSALVNRLIGVIDQATQTVNL